MPYCFVIQPFDEKFDKLFDEVYKPAIESAELEAYRVDRDPKVEITIDAIEEGIINSAICLADITTDNPNVWYELGCAFAANRAVIMVCSDERKDKYPFDIQHRPIVRYKAEAPSDFKKLRDILTERLKALLKKNENEVFRQIEESKQLAPHEGLSQTELIVLAKVAGNSSLADGGISPYSLKSDSKRLGLTEIGFSLAFKRLDSKKLIEIFQVDDRNNFGEPLDLCRLTDKGWGWVDANESLFIHRKQQPKATEDDGVPF